MVVGLLETRNAIREVSLPTLHQRNKVEALLKKMISEQEKKNGLLKMENAELQERKIALEKPADQTFLDKLEKEISQLKQAIENAREQELSLNQEINHKQQVYTRRLSDTEKRVAAGRYFQHTGL